MGVAILLSLTVACRQSTTEAPSAPGRPVAQSVAESRASCPDIASIVARYECGKCHGGLAGPTYSVRESCVTCHTQILAGTFEAPDEAMRRWQTNIVSLVDVPSLANANARLRASFVRDFLAAPYDVRPGLRATMPRLALAPAEIEALACALGGPDGVAPRGDVARGAALFDARACNTCHARGDVPARATTDDRAHRLAPDLALVRVRYRADALVAWLRAPTSLLPDTAMPSHGFTENEARDVAVFLLDAESVRARAIAIPERLPLLTRPVRYEEIEQRILHRVCWHCHGDPDYAGGMGGPGNSGGFGFPARGVNLATLEGIMSGRLVGTERASLFERTADGTPLLVAVMLARHREVAGSSVSGVRGMPLGLPPVPMEEIQLVESWIAQGRPP